MKISKNNVLKVFTLFKNIYIDFEKKIENEEKLKGMIHAWIEIFNTIEFDYEEANEDFLEASKTVISKSKYVPTIAEISEEMKKIYNKRIENKQKNIFLNVCKIEEECYLKSTNIDRAIDLYCKINKKHNNNEIVLLIKKYRNKEKINNDMYLNTENIFEKIMGEEIE